MTHFTCLFSIHQLNKKKDKKRKRADDPSKKGTIKEQSASKREASHRDTKKKIPSQKSNASSIPSVAQEARSAVQSAVESNPVLSNLFGSKKNASEKERRDALFTRNC